MPILLRWIAFCGLFIFWAPATSQLQAVRAWTYIYDGPGHGLDLPADATLDRQGYIYLTGRSSGAGPGPDIATVRVSPSGQEALVLRYNSPANSWDEGNSLAVDDEGNIFVAGTSSVTSSTSEIVLLKYSPSGALLWQSRFLPDSLEYAAASVVVLDRSGNVYVGGSANGRFLLLRYNPDGGLARSVTFGDDSTYHELTTLLVAGDGHLVLGGSRTRESGGDVPTIEFTLMASDTQGTLLWREYLALEPVRTALLDRDGDLVLITHGDGTTVKYSPEGELRWFRNQANSDTAIFLLTGLAIDSLNNIVVGGYDCDPNCFDFAVMKYDPDGNVLWRRSYDSPETLRDVSLNLAVDRHGAVYLTGHSAPDYSGSRCLTIAHDSAGSFLWETTYAGVSDQFADGEFVFVDDSGDVYIAGSSVASTGWDYFVVKYRQDIDVDVPAAADRMPQSHSLSQNFPNPFNPRTTISYSLPGREFVMLRVFDLLGREVATLVAAEQQAGEHAVEFDARDVPSGVYLYRLSAGSFTQTKSLVLLR